MHVRTPVRTCTLHGSVVQCAALHYSAARALYCTTGLQRAVAVCCCAAQAAWALVEEDQLSSTTAAEKDIEATSNRLRPRPADEDAERPAVSFLLADSGCAAPSYRVRRRGIAAGSTVSDGNSLVLAPESCRRLPSRQTRPRRRSTTSSLERPAVLLSGIEATSSAPSLLNDRNIGYGLTDLLDNNRRRRRCSCTACPAPLPILDRKTVRPVSLLR